MKKIIIIITLFSIAILAFSDQLPPEVRNQYIESCGLPPWVGENIDRDEEKFGSYWYKNVNWKAGQVINVYFKNGTQDEKAITKFYTSEWARYGNFSFNFKKGEKTSDEEAIIIEFNHELTKKGICGYSSVGSGSKQWKYASLTLDCVGARTVIHEIGHTLGFKHEQDNPDGGHQYVMREFYAYYAKKGYTKDQLDKWREGYKNKQFYDWTSFDRYSVMAYSMPGNLFKDGRSFGGHDHLSAGDKDGVRRLYPGKEMPKDINNNFLFRGKDRVVLDVLLKNGSSVDIFVNSKLVKSLNDSASGSYGLRQDVDITGFLGSGYQKNTISYRIRRNNIASEIMLYLQEKDNNGKYTGYVNSTSCFGLKSCSWEPENLNHNVSFNIYRLNTADYYTGAVTTKPENTNNTNVIINKTTDYVKWNGTYTCGTTDNVVLKVDQTGVVRGNYNNNAGSFSGKVSDQNSDLIQGEWKSSNGNAIGNYYFYLKDTQLKGQWAYKTDKSWRAAWNCTRSSHKIIVNKPETENKVSKALQNWVKSYDCGKSGALNLSIKDEGMKQLDGSFGPNNGKLSGVVQGPNLDQFTGQWYFPNNSAKGMFFFYLKNNALVGYWRYPYETKWRSGWNCK